MKTWHVLRYLSGIGHKITLVSFVRPEEVEHLKALEEVCAAVYAIPIRRSRPADLIYWLKSQWTRRPFLVERDDSQQMRSLVRKLIETGDVDVIHADQLTMAQFAPASQFGWKDKFPAGIEAPAAMLDAHNAVWTILDRMTEKMPWFLRPAVALESRRIKRYEGEILGLFDRVMAVTEIDRQALFEAARFAKLKESEVAEKVFVIPIAVNTSQILPVERVPGSLNITTLGTLHYPPNADGIRWFLQEVFPQVLQKIPGASLTIIGKNPPKDFVLAAEQSSGKVVVTGYVASLDEYFANAAVIVIPVRAGGGMRVRILEAFSRALPVVTTTIGLEGIDAQPGTDLLVADSADDYVSAVIRLLSDPSLQSTFADHGRRFVVEHYDWQVVLKKMGDLYQTF